MERIDSVLRYTKIFARSVARSSFVALNNLYCIPTYVIWMTLLHPLRIYDESLYWRLEGQAFYWLLTMVGYWSYSAGYHVHETGDNIEELIGEETLLLVNHQSTSDVPLLMAAFCARNNILQNITWVMDAVFKYTNFGIVSAFHGDFFIDSGRNRRDATLKDFAQYLHDVYIPRKRKWIVLFPEGGFLRKRKETSKRFAAKNNYPNLEHVTLPRMGAIQVIMDALGPNSCKSRSDIPNNNVETTSGKLKYVVDLTIAYPNGKPLDLGTVVSGHLDPCKIHFHYRIFPIDELPTDSSELQDWLFTRYREKDEMLGKFYETGKWEPFGMNRGNGKFVSETELPSDSESLDVFLNAEEEDVAALASSISNHSTCDNTEYRRLVKASAKVRQDGLNNVLSMESPSTLSFCNDLCQSFRTSPSRVKQDPLRIMVLHFMFLTSSWCHLVAFKSLYSYVAWYMW